jgi:hypothetical protein
MRTRTFLSLIPLGLALTTVAASRADAQNRRLVTVCRDGTRTYSNDRGACEGRGGVDGRATDTARRYEADRAANGTYSQRDNRQTDPRYDPRQTDPRYDPRANDRNRNNDGRYDNGGYNNNGGYNTGYGNGRNEVYEWQGTVDREIQIQLRGNRASVQPIGNSEPRSGYGRMLNGLPQQNGTLVVERLEGRGNVDVIEQPSARNGYTATLRIRDPNSGASNYRIAAYWQSANGNTRYDRRFGRN